MDGKTEDALHKLRLRIEDAKLQVSGTPEGFGYRMGLDRALELLEEMLKELNDD